MYNRTEPAHFQKTPSGVVLNGRILFLTEDPALIEEQIEGLDLDPTTPPVLRDDISTDEMTPSHICLYFDDRLGDFVYTGLKCGGQLPIKKGDVKGKGFVASVAGKRRGKGSSREHSPFAELAAGFKLVIGENIERIYKQNAQNLGLLTSTDFGLLQRINSGEEISLDELTRGEDEITRQIIAYGGLLPFNLARLRGQITLPCVSTAPRPMTLAEK